MSKKMFFLTMSLVFAIIIQAQSSGYTEQIRTGLPMPDFIVKNIKYFNKTEATLNDFKGKWLILDFWNRFCGSCVASFPRVSKMKKEIEDRAQVIMVGIQDKENQIQPLYEKYRKREDLTMPCAFDSSLAKRFDIVAGPYIVIIDDKGVVRAITYEITSDDMLAFFDGKTPDLHSLDDLDSNNKWIPLQRSKPLMVDNNGIKDGDFLFRSFLSKYNSQVHNRIYLDSPEATNIKNGLLQAMPATLQDLYFFAYWGKWCRTERNGEVPGWNPYDTVMDGNYFVHPILDLKDSSLFDFSYKKNGKNLFIYGLAIPPEKSSTVVMQEALQRDLKTYFGYDVTIETRKCFYYRLISSSGTEKKIKAKGGDTEAKNRPFSGACWNFKNTPFKQVIYWLRQMIYMKIGGNQYYPYIQDETGITENVDLNFDCIETIDEDLKQALFKNGLQLVPAEKDMKVLVIRDPPQ